jgi:tetratricopeptide (TPR) repeat protein
VSHRWQPGAEAVLQSGFVLFVQETVLEAQRKIEDVIIPRMGIRTGFDPPAISIVGMVLSLLIGVASSQTSPASAASTVEALREHDYATAFRLSETLTSANPNNPQAWTLKGLALMNLGRHQLALKAFHQALAIEPNYVAALEAAAQLEYDAGSPEAEELLGRLLRLNPQDQTANAMSGVLAYHRKDCSAAVAHFEKSAEVIRDQPLALGEFGSCLLREKEPENAIAVFQRLEQMHPGDWRLTYNLGLVQFLAHHNGDAIETLQPLADSPSPNADALNLISAVYEANQQLPEAVAALQRAIQVAPQDVDNYFDLAALSLIYGPFQVGIDVLNAALKIVPGSASLYIERGVLYVQLGQYQQADEDFQRADDLQPAQNFGTAARGISLLQENEVGQSLKLLRGRLKQAPNDPALNYALAESLIRKGVLPGTAEFQEARDAAQKAVRSKPDFALAYDALGVLDLRAGLTSQAADADRRALQADPEDFSAAYHLLLCLRKGGDQEEVRELVKKLAAMSAARAKADTANRFRLAEEAPDAAASPLPGDSRTTLHRGSAQ